MVDLYLGEEFAVILGNGQVIASIKPFASWGPSQCTVVLNSMHTIFHLSSPFSPMDLFVQTSTFTSFTRVIQLAFHACWRMWKLSTIAKRMGVKSLERQAVARLTHSMHVWVAYIIQLRLNPERYVIAVSHWSRKCLQTYFNRWSQTLRYWRLGVKEEKLLMGKAVRHFSKMLLRYCYDSWQDWLKAYARPKRKRFATVQAHINKMTMKQAVGAWRCIVYVKWVRRIKFEEAAELSKIWCIKRTFRRSSHLYILFPVNCVMDLHG